MEYNYFRVFYSPDKDGDSFSHSSNIKFKKDISRLKRGLKESSRTIEERVRIIEGAKYIPYSELQREITI